VSAATRPTGTTGENRVMREPMAHRWPGAYLPRRSRALEVGAGSGTNGTKLRRFAGQRKIVGRPAALPTTYVPSEGPMLQYTYLIVGGGITADDETDLERTRTHRSHGSRTCAIGVLQ